MHGQHVSCAPTVRRPSPLAAASHTARFSHRSTKWAALSHPTDKAVEARRGHVLTGQHLLREAAFRRLAARPVELPAVPRGG